MPTLTCRRCGGKYQDSGDGYNGFCPECADHYFSRVCEVCNEPVAWEGGRLHHVTDDGEIDSNADEDHSPVNHDDEPPKRPDPTESGGQASDQEEALSLTVPTYHGHRLADEVMRGEAEEYGPPFVPIVAYREAGLRILLGTTDLEDETKPDLKIERRPRGWAVFVHPNAGDPSAYLYVLDSGRTYLVKDSYGPPFEVVRSLEDIPELDD